MDGKVTAKRVLRAAHRRVLRALGGEPMPRPSSGGARGQVARPKSRPRSADVALYTKLYGAEAVRRKQFVNIGAGAFGHPAWTTVDYWQPAYEKLLKHARPDIDHDLSTSDPIPLDDATIHLAYTSHTIEHLQQPMVARMFAEVHRMLRPGGVFRITCPSAELAWQALKRDDMLYFRTFSEVHAVTGGNWLHDRAKPYKDRRRGVHYAFLEQMARQCCHDPKRYDQAVHALDSLPMEDALDAVCGLCTWDENRKTPGYHLNWFTEAKLRRMLEAAGFKTVLRSGFRQSVAPVLRDIDHFDRTRPNFSIYVEAFK